MINYISVPIIGKITVYKETWQSVFAHLHFNVWKEIGGKIRQWKLVQACTKSIEQVMKVR